MSELLKITSNLDRISLGIMDLIKTDSKSSNELGEILSVDNKTIKRRYPILLKQHLIEMAIGKGIKITPRGIIL